MENKHQTLVCITSSYPYGTRETYFENELQYLAKEFKTIYIQPTYNPFKTHAQRNIPANVVVIKEPMVPSGKQARLLRGIFNSTSMSMFVKDFLKNKAYRSKPALSQWLNTLLIHRISYPKMEKLLKRVDKNALLYTYWANNPPVFATELCRPYKKIVRMHFGDFYLDRFDGYMPVRSDLYNSAELLVPISNDISAILQDFYKIDKSKIFVNHLGIDNTAEYCTVKESAVVRIVSCSHLEPRKRVHLIAEALTKYTGTQQIEWHHFGGGTEMGTIQDIVKRLGKNVTANLHGPVSQAQLYQFYQDNYVDWFLNVSTGEGIPVSIMEAFSFGIPAIATNGGATYEIVNTTNGHLIPKDFDTQIIADLLAQPDPNYRRKRAEALNTWSDKFNAASNYSQLVKKMQSL